MSKRWALDRWLPLLAVLLAGLLLRFWRLGELALIGDESYYWLWSRHLDWAYFDHPAGVALQIGLSTILGGQSEVGVRWLNALLGAGSVLLTYRLGEQMLSRRAGLFAALAVAVGAPYLLTSRFIYTDALQLFLLLVNLYWFWQLIGEKPTPHLATVAAFGCSLALLFNTKYNAYLYACALLLVLLVDHRTLLAQRRLWLAASIAAVGLVPVLAWNASHEWASFRWQLAHFGFTLTGDASLLGTVQHSLAYLSWPLVALALLGLGRFRRPAERLLGLVALLLLLPVALSAANSPRNLSTGLVPLLLLAGARWPTWFDGRRRKGVGLLLAPALFAAAVYGIGTVAGTFAPTAWPHSSVVPSIRRDAAGWRELGPDLSTHPQPLFALDYSIASQIQYYGGVPAYSSWGQYRIWGIPEFQDATIISLDYVPADSVSSQLRGAFQHVEGPEYLRYEERGAVKEVRIWYAQGLRMDQEAFLQTFDFLTLWDTLR